MLARLPSILKMSTIDITLQHVRAATLPKGRKTKIVCTLGPACWSVEGLISLIDAGMNLARFNFSHGDHATHLSCLERLRTAVSMRPGCNVAVMLDTKGPEIRTGVVDPSCGGKLTLEKGQNIEVGTDYSRTCTSDYLACSYLSLPKSVTIGSPILVADGALSLRVVEVKSNSVIAEILNNASFGDKKNMNLPGAIVDLPTLTEKDCDDLVNFGVKYGVDFIAASFVRKASDVLKIREVLGAEGANIKIISKIENQEGLENFDEILSVTDGIMVARGDLGMEIPLEKVFLAQKMMISKANFAGKPVVTATQMLESMIVSPRATRAEVSDVANAVLDGTDCVMLSGETANGSYGVEAVTTMRNTCLEAERVLDYEALYTSIRRKMLSIGDLTPSESLASTAAKTARDLEARLIICVSETGNSARLISKYRPKVPVLVLTTHEQVARQVQGYMQNCISEVIPSAHNTEDIITTAIARKLAEGVISKGEPIVCIYGKTEAVAGTTNMLQIFTA